MSRLGHSLLQHKGAQERRGCRTGALGTSRSEVELRSPAHIPSRMSVLCLAAAAAAMCMGCTTATLSQLPPADQAKYKGTEPGWHQLSPYFGVEIRSNARATFFHVRDPQAPKTRESIGGQDMFWPHGPYNMAGVMRIADPKFGPRENAYAISEDGRALLYFKDGGGLLRHKHDDDRYPNEFGAELHLYRHGLGDSLIVSDVDHWVSRSWNDPAVPADAVVFALPDKHGHRAARSLWTRGEEVVRSIGEFMPR